MNQTVFIIDTYDPYFSKLIQDTIRYKFVINDVWFVVREVVLEWGAPILGPRPIEEEREPNFHYFNTLEEAKQFARELKRINDGL